MAQTNRPYGKDNPERFISGALTGGSGESNGIVEKAIDRPSQKINTAFGMDNVQLAMKTKSSLRDEGGIGGGVDNLKHSLTGTSAVNEEVGAAGKLKHTIIPNH